MSSNDLVTHQAHKNGQYYDLKWQKFFSIAKETQKIEFFQNFQMTSKMFLDIVGVITTSKLSILKTFQGGLFNPMSNRVKNIICILHNKIFKGCPKKED